MIPLKDKILVLDGAMGTMIQRYGLTEEDYRGDVFAACEKELRGNNDCLCITRPDIIKAIHKEYIDAGADIIESNTFSANRISQAEYGCEEFAAQMAYAGAQIAREAADDAMKESGRKVWVAGSVGPTSKSLSLSPDVADPAFRAYSFEKMSKAYGEQIDALVRGGVDVILIETCFDALNVKAAIAGYESCSYAALLNTNTSEPSKKRIPVMVSVSVGDRSGRTLTGQTLEAFYISVKHAGLLSFGLNCSLGAAELMPLVEDINRWCASGVSCYPNAGLPNEMGGYDQSPKEMAAQVCEMASRGLVNIVGGCCGTTPDHIREIALAVADIKPKQLDVTEENAVSVQDMLKVSGLEAVIVDKSVSNFTNVGERTNVAGSRKFARLIAEGKYDEALQIAAKQIEDGARIIDVNMDDAMLDSTREMQRFVRYISNDPAVAKAALMIDSSHWETIVAGLQNAQGKCIVNSISLKEGTEAFVEKARIIKSYGAAVVVMAFDEEGQATTYERKVEICERAYKLLTEEAGIAPSDIIFDVNILSIGTGIEEHAKYAIDFIEAVRWIKANLPGALTSGGVSNLSFSFRGNNAVREAMHSAFLYHAIKAGLDMAIVNPSMLQVYDDIEPELLKCVEDVIFDTDHDATERLIEKASQMLASKNQEENKIQEKELPKEPLEVRLQNALVKGQSANLEADIKEAIEKYGTAVSIIEGPLMAGMETVGKLFGEGKMFLPQVVKSAKVMRDAVTFLEPYMDIPSNGHESKASSETSKPIVVLATVKGDVHDIGKNITGIVLTCNGFEVKDLGVMVDKETILDEAQKSGADLIAVSGLITPSLYQMEEICKDMKARGMNTPLFIGGATTSAVHTAVKLAPLYGHVFYGPDASAAAVLAKKCMMDREGFEAEQHAEQEKLREMYYKADSETPGKTTKTAEPTSEESCDGTARQAIFPESSYVADCPSDIPVSEIPLAEVLPYFDWKMFYAIWGVKYGSAVPEAMELMQLRRDAEEELSLEDFRIMLTARFFPACCRNEDICFEANKGYTHGCEVHSEISLPMMRQESGKGLSLCDFVIPAESGKKSVFGMFAISVHKKSKAHVQGCSCPACSNAYEDMIGRTVRMTLAEAASKWLDTVIKADCMWTPSAPVLTTFEHPLAEGGTPIPSITQSVETTNCNNPFNGNSSLKITKPAAGYASCPDHTLKGDILKLLGVTEGEAHKHEHCHEHHHHEGHHGHECGCCGHSANGMGIGLTDSYAMTPESSICGFIFIHPEASYPDIRKVSKDKIDEYASRRGMDEETARRFLGHLLK